MPEGDYTVPLGKAKVRARRAEHVTVIAWGAMLYEALAAADQAAEQGIECEVIDLRTLWPLDIDTIVASVKKTGRVVVVHEAPQDLRLRRRDRRARQRGLLPPPRGAAVRVTGFDTPFPYTLENEYLPLAPPHPARRIVETAQMF